MPHRLASRRGILARIALLAGCILPLASCGTSEGGERQAGVISTGNAGRVLGEARYDDAGRTAADVSIRLLRRVDSGWVDVDSQNTDSGGQYRFQELTEGTYRVVARSPSGELGASAPFEVDGQGDVRVLVILVRVARVVLLYVPPAGDAVASIQVEGTGVTGVPGAAGWSVDLREGSEDTLRVVLSSGTHRYAIHWEGNSPVLSPSDTASPELGVVRLLADWTFDESDTLVDHSGHGNGGRLHGGVTALPGESALRFDGRSGYVSLGECLVWNGRCVDWSDTDLVLQIRFRVDTQTVPVVAHLVSISSGNGEVMIKRIPGDTIAVVLAMPSGWTGLNIPWKEHLGRWVDLVFVRDAAARSGTVYLDGSRYGTFPVPDALNKVEGLFPAFGAYDRGGSPDYFARMDMERARVWLGTLGDEQVRDLHGSF